ncbi:MAG: helix-turn-helix transcriptional regulator [Mycobacteriaceae bacterium]|nr:helix-turn-helix transcriptional regulator [Mycobacteriaceae bacterium]
MTSIGSRKYGDPCGVARSLNVLGDRWALLIVRDLLLGPKRFKDLQDGLQDAGPNVLTQRLADLADAHVVGRRRLPPPADVWVYELTERGQALEPVLIHLGRWGSDLPYRSDRRILGTDSLVLGMKASFDSHPAVDLAGTYELWIGADVFTIHLDRTALSAKRATVAGPQAVIHTDSETLTRIVMDGLAPQDAIARGKLVIEGGQAARAEALLELAAGNRPR